MTDAEGRGSHVEVAEELVTPVTAPETPWFWAVGAGLAAFLLYVVTLAPTTAFWDASEYIATAHILGIPHPPGNPFFVFVAKVWTLLWSPTGLPVAVRVNLFAAATTAGATACFLLVAHRILWGLTRDDRVARVGAVLSALLAATPYTVWTQSNVNEKVYTLSVFLIGLVSLLAIRWYDDRHRPGAERKLLWCVLLLALGSTSHMMSVLPAPALGVLVLMAAPGLLVRPAFVGRALALIALGLSFNFVLPVRAGLDPVINEGDPECSSLTSTAAAVFSAGRAGCPALASSLTREQYQAPPVTQRKAPFAAQMANYGQYFEWQWSRGLDPAETPSPKRRPFTFLFLALGILGLRATWSADRAMFGYFAVLTATLTVALVYYLNFRFGYSLAPEIVDRTQHEVRERDYFFVAGFLLWGALAGIGLTWVWHALAREIGKGSGERALLLTSPLLVVAFIPAALNWTWADRSGDYAARDWAYDLLMSVEPYAVLFTNGDNDTFPLWYLQEVEGIRRDVTVIVGQYLYTTWYPLQLQDLTNPERQRPFDDETLQGWFADVQSPDQSILSLEKDVLDQVGSARLSQDLTIALSELAVTYPAGMVLDRSEQIALSIIHDVADERPVYFSSSAGLLSQLGLDPWGVRHGLTTKLVMRDLEEATYEGLTQVAPQYGGEWYDLARSLRLYDEVYLFRGIRDREIWQDRSTLNIPWQYYAMALQLSDAARSADADEGTVARLEDDALAFATVAQGGVRGTPALTPP